jgi:hypothetical protein
MYVLAEPPRLDLAQRGDHDALLQHAVCEQLLAERVRPRGTWDLEPLRLIILTA